MMKKKSLLITLMALSGVLFSCGKTPTDPEKPDPDVPVEPAEKTGTVKISATTNGTVKADKTSGKVGDTITLTITANESYEIDTVKHGDTVLTVTNGKATFKLVEGENVITATFKKVVEPDPDIPSNPITDLKLNAEEISLGTKKDINVENTFKLVATITPEDTTDDKKVTFTSADSKIATVAEDGTITAVALGTTTISAKAGTKEAKVTVNVKANHEVRRDFFLTHDKETAFDTIGTVVGIANTPAVSGDWGSKPEGATVYIQDADYAYGIYNVTKETAATLTVGETYTVTAKRNGTSKTNWNLTDATFAVSETKIAYKTFDYKDEITTNNKFAAVKADNVTILTEVDSKGKTVYKIADETNEYKFNITNLVSTDAIAAKIESLVEGQTANIKGVIDGVGKTGLTIKATGEDSITLNEAPVAPVTETKATEAKLSVEGNKAFVTFKGTYNKDAKTDTPKVIVYNGEVGAASIAEGLVTLHADTETWECKVEVSDLHSPHWHDIKLYLDTVTTDENGAITPTYEMLKADILEADFTQSAIVVENPNGAEGVTKTYKFAEYAGFLKLDVQIEDTSNPVIEGLRVVADNGAAYLEVYGTSAIKEIALKVDKDEISNDQSTVTFDGNNFAVRVRVDEALATKDMLNIRFSFMKDGNKNEFEITKHTFNEQIHEFEGCSINGINYVIKKDGWMNETGEGDVWYKVAKNTDDFVYRAAQLTEKNGKAMLRVAGTVKSDFIGKELTWKIGENSYPVGKASASGNIDFTIDVTDEAVASKVSMGLYDGEKLLNNIFHGDWHQGNDILEVTVAGSTYKLEDDAWQWKFTKIAA